MADLLAAGYDVIPVNPNERAVHGRACYPDLATVPDPVQLVDVFRRAEATPEIARAAVAIGARALWLQLGVVNEEAAAIARAAGLEVVMDRCLAVEHERLVGRPFPGAPGAPADPVGLCGSCAHAKRVPTDQTTYWLCRRSAEDASFEKYPRLPMRGCRGWEPGTP
jgi:predicted CoA-binding protein